MMIATPVAVVTLVAVVTPVVVVTLVVVVTPVVVVMLVVVVAVLNHNLEESTKNVRSVPVVPSAHHVQTQPTGVVANNFSPIKEVAHATSFYIQLISNSYLLFSYTI
ncbi:MAG: hypothetical protein RR490_04845 [Niameybacter sp.]